MWVLDCHVGFPLGVVSRDYPLGGVCGLFIVVASLVEEQNPGSKVQGLQQLRHMDSEVVAPRLLWPTGLVALRHVKSSWIRDQTCVSSIGRRILYF